MKLRFEDGTVRETEALDINVWNADLYGDDDHTGVVVTAYPMNKTEDGYWDTALDLIVFSIPTDLDPDDWDDDWFGYSDDTAPGEFPGDVRSIVEGTLKKITE